MKLKIEITMDNAAFDGPNRNIELATALRGLAHDIEEGNELSDVRDHCTLRDMNGNNVGEARIVCNKLRAEDEAFFQDAFTNPVTKQPYEIPDNLKLAATRICRSYGIWGSCDPMYIANVIAVELGLGDGQSNFSTAPTIE